jgi:hypothetical protein
MEGLEFLKAVLCKLAWFFECSFSKRFWREVMM